MSCHFHSAAPDLLRCALWMTPCCRMVQDGVRETGVSVAYTVLRCDAGPVLAQQGVAVDGEVQAPQLLEGLFEAGTQLLLQHLPDVWAGRGAAMAVPQDDGAASHAAKVR